MVEQLDLWHTYDSIKRAEFENLFPEFEQRINQIINGFTDSSQLTEEAKQQTIQYFKEIQETTNQSAPKIIRSFTNFQVARTLTMLLSDINELTPGELEVANEYLMPPTLDIENVLRQVDDEILQTKRDCIEYALRFGIMPPHAAYYDPTGWVGLVEQQPYKRNHDAAETLIQVHNSRFVDIALPKDAKKMVMSDLGPGDGSLTVVVTDTALKGRENIKFEDFLIDESMGMLFIAITTLIQKYSNYILMLTRTPNKQAIHRKWLSPLIDIMRSINNERAKNHKLRVSDKMAFLTTKLKKILEQFIKQNNDKYKVKEAEETAGDSDKRVKLYVNPDKMPEEEIEKRASQTSELLKMLIARMFSLHKSDDSEDIIKIDNTDIPLRIHPIQTTFDKLDLGNLNATPEMGVLHHIYGNTPNNYEDPEEFLREIVSKKLLNEPTVNDNEEIICANYCVIGVQIRKGRAHPGMLKPYDNEPSKNFVGSLFLDPKAVSYHDPNNNYKQITDLNEVFDIEFGFENAPGRPKMLRIAPRLIYKKDVVGKNSNNLSDTRFIDQHTDILLLPINRPTMWQWEEFCHHTNIYIEEVVEDETYGTEVVHFLVRGKTKQEKDDYQNILKRRVKNQKRRAESQKLHNPDDSGDIDFEEESEFGEEGED
jgi:hypothetical protein